MSDARSTTPDDRETTGAPWFDGSVRGVIVVALIGVAFLPADWLEDLTGWVLEPYWILPAAILVLLLAGALLCRQIVLNRSRARAEEDEIAMSRGDLATEELRRQEESESERPGS